MKLIAILTCHNRREKTLSCLRHLLCQTAHLVRLSAYLVDDGCTDGTADAIRASFGDVKILTGGGDLFWSRGTRLAWEYAAREAPDFYLWLNDDTMLRDGAIETLLSTWSAAARPETIVVGSCCDPITGARTYGGAERVSRHPAVLRQILPQAFAVRCDTFEGNVVLIPKCVYDRVGAIDVFQHAMGDIDYGYRASRAGCQCLVAPGFVATCERNPRPTHHDRSLPRAERWRLLNSRKELPFRDWLRFTRRHGGFFWPIYFVRPYIRVLLNLGPLRNEPQRLPHSR